MDDREHLAHLLDEHDGDDRCGCLRDVLFDLVIGECDTHGAVLRVSECLATHPAGLTMRERFNRSLDRSLE